MIKRFGVLAVILALVASVLPVGTVSAFTGSGAGTVGDPFRITTCVQLQEMNDDLDAHYILMNDIDCSSTSGWNAGEGFAPIGPGVNWPTDTFTGTFDGQNHVITGLFINRTTDATGLFGFVSPPAEISNVGLTGVDITGETFVGGLAGSLDSTPIVIENSYVEGSVTGEEDVGGLVGTSSDATIKNSYADVTVTGVEVVGGLVGYSGGTIQDSYASGNVNSDDDDGGGLVGENGGIIQNSYADVEMAGDGGGKGGLVGENNGTIEKSYALGNVLGGFGLGGLVSTNNGDITDSYATGNVSGDDNIGGLVGYNDGCCGGGTITNSYSIGSVTGTNEVGGLVGHDELGAGTATESFWNTETSGQATSALGVGKTTAELKDIATFQTATWDIDFDTTNLNDGYPFLSWQAGDSSPVWYMYQAASSVSDGDGISDTVEDAAPNAGDGNNDGTDDSQQANVVSFVSQTSNKYVTLEVSSACTITAASMGAESATTKDIGFDYPQGLMSFTLNCGTPGFTATVTQYYHGVSGNNLVLRKYNPTTNAYTAVTGATIQQTTIAAQAVTKATYQVTDGGTLDTDGTANGTIVDPAGLAQGVVGAPNTGLGGQLYN